MPLPVTVAVNFTQAATAAPRRRRLRVGGLTASGTHCRLRLPVTVAVTQNLNAGESHSVTGTGTQAGTSSRVEPNLKRVALVTPVLHRGGGAPLPVAVPVALPA
jgi:hypothetical protein